MTLTIEEAQARLPKIVAKAEAGEEVLLTKASGQPAVKLVPAKRGRARLERHPALVGSVVIHDREALLQPLPPDEWGGLADLARSPLHRARRLDTYIRASASSGEKADRTCLGGGEQNSIGVRSVRPIEVRVTNLPCLSG